MSDALQDHNEHIEQRITNALQEIDMNFMKALKCSNNLLKQVQAYQSTTKDVAQSLKAWTKLFDIFAESYSFNTTQTPLPCKKQAQNVQDDSYTMSTPSMPSFSKSFAKTPMARALYMEEEEETKGDEEDSMLRGISPPISTPFFKPSKTPGPGFHGDDTPEDTPDLKSPPVCTPFLQSVKPANSGIDGFNTPGTPPTPLDGDYGPASAAKSQILLFGTPANSVTKVLLSSGTRAAAERRFQAHKNSGALEHKLFSESRTPSASTLNYSMEKSSGTPLSENIAKRLKPSIIDSRHVDMKVEANELVESLVENIDEESPPFDVKLFPSLFQNGEGASQITSVYSKFLGLKNEKEALSLDQLSKILPFERERIELMLEMLVSRRFLRPFICQNKLFWRRI